MARYQLELVGRNEIAASTIAFRFAKPTGFQFDAGQFIDMQLVNPPETDAKGAKRTFSLASAPFEEHLMIATRARDTAFKRVLTAMQLGKEVEMEGPFGSLTLDEGLVRPAVFLAGGIGITPFRSMALQATKKGFKQKIYLFYSNRRPEDTAFLAEMHQLAERNSNLQLIATMTQMERSDRTWNGETGRITHETLVKYVENLKGPVYYVAGPPSMVTGMGRLLVEAGVKGEDVCPEEFAGY